MTANSIDCLAFSDDGLSLFTAGADTIIRRWCIASQSIKSYLRYHTLPVTALAVTADAHWLFSGSSKESVIAWSLTDAQPPRVLTGHRDFVSGFVLSAQWLVSLGCDGLAALWALPGLELQQRAVAHPGGVLWGVPDADGQGFFTGGKDGFVREWSYAELTSLREWAVAAADGGPALPLCGCRDAASVFVGTSASQVLRIDAAGGLNVLHASEGEKWVSAVTFLADKLYFVVEFEELHCLGLGARQTRAEEVALPQKTGLQALTRNGHGGALALGGSDGSLILAFKADFRPEPAPPTLSSRPSNASSTIGDNYARAAARVFGVLARKPADAESFFRGKMRNWQKEGECEELVSDGFFVGKYVDGLRHGPGQLLRPDGLCVAGEFVRGRLVGEIWLGDPARERVLRGRTPGFLSVMDVEAEEIFAPDSTLLCQRHDRREPSPFDFSGQGVLQRRGAPAETGTFVGGELTQPAKPEPKRGLQALRSAGSLSQSFEGLYLGRVFVLGLDGPLRP